MTRKAKQDASHWLGYPLGSQATGKQAKHWLNGSQRRNEGQSVSQSLPRCKQERGNMYIRVTRVICIYMAA